MKIIFYKLGSDNVEEILARDPTFLTFKNMSDQAIAISEEKVQLSQRIMRLMENSLSRLSIETKSSKKKQKEEPVMMSVETTQSEEQRTYCICGQVIT